MQMKIVLQADPDSATHCNRDSNGGKLSGANSSERPQRVGRNILKHGRHVTQATLGSGDVSQDDVQVAGRGNDLLAKQIGR